MNATPVWDRFVRVFHWSLVTCIAVDYLWLDDGKEWHQWLGYTAVALVTARIVWGFIGSPHARFADFFPTPTRLRQHFKALASGHVPSHDGHNPLGALMILALLTLVLLLGLTGWMQTLDAFWGDEWLQSLHEVAANALVSLAVLHIGAALVMGRLERTHLIRAMVTGVKVRW